MSVRVHAIAKEVNKTSKEIVEILKGRGYDIKSASSTLDNITAQSIIEEFSSSNQEAQGTADPKEEQPEPSVEVEEKAEDTEIAKDRKIPIVKSKEDFGKRENRKGRGRGKSRSPCRKKEENKPEHRSGSFFQCSSVPPPPSSKMASAPPPPSSAGKSATFTPEKGLHPSLQMSNRLRVAWLKETSSSSSLPSWFAISLGLLGSNLSIDFRTHGDGHFCLDEPIDR